ncbi:MAG: hypothetical protein IPN29_15545 [Saprospiraceae bacterium]|nr:hypothetical protein [Saprospiraceae bacterium]
MPTIYKRMKNLSIYLPLLILFLGACHPKFHTNSTPKVEPAEQLFIAKQYPAQFPDFEAMSRAHHQALQQIKMGNRTNGSWELQGPGNIGARINSIAIHPLNSKILFAGFADGGLWRTLDGCKSWQPVFDDQIWQSIGSISFDPLNPNIVYAGTGDPNVSGYPRAGGGIYKSADLGETWTFKGLGETRIISRIAIHKSAPSTIYVAAMGTPFLKNSDRGVYKSTDAGNTWKQVLLINDSTGVSDLIIHPTNPSRLYAIGWNRIRNSNKSLVSGPDAKIFRSDDGGENWEILSNGLPTGNFTRMGICQSEGNPNVLYVQYTNANTLNLESIYKTTDGGDIWTLHTMGTDNGLPGSALGGFGWYFGKLKVNPSDENDLFLLGVGIYRYNANGGVWQDAGDNDYLKDPHADKHDLIFSGDSIYLATDGGLYRCNLYGVPNWEDVENIPTTQFYRTAYNPHQPDSYYGGAQDNGTSSGNGATTNGWQRIWGGDGFQMAFRLDNSEVMYVETQRGNIAVTSDGGNDWDNATNGLSGSRHWDMQYIISSHDPDVLYTGTDRFYKSDVGVIPDWKPISDVLVDPSSPAIIHQFTCLSESPLDARVLYCGTSDAMVWQTRDGGNIWTRITNGLPTRYISSIKASPAKPATVYVTLTGYKDNDSKAHIYKSENYGLNWIPIAGNLPPYAINDVLIYPNGLDNILFVATDGGIYLSVNGGAFWERLGNNMPLIPVFDMDYHIENNALIGATFARGIQTFDLDQLGINLEPVQTDENFTVFTWDLESNTVTSQLYLKGEIPAKLSILDLRGKLVQSFAGTESADIGHLLPGMYIISDGIKSVKFVKQ